MVWSCRLDVPSLLRQLGGGPLCPGAGSEKQQGTKAQFFASGTVMKMSDPCPLISSSTGLSADRFRAARSSSTVCTDGRDAALAEVPTAQACEAETADAARRRARGQSWAALMARTFGFDVLACPRCGGRLRLVALIEQATVIERILRHLGVPTATPASRPARAPPLLAGVPDVAGSDDDASVFDPCS